jgi:hypothetical protein
MDKPSTEVVQFAPKQKRGELEPIDQAGHALIRARTHKFGWVSAAP